VRDRLSTGQLPELPVEELPEEELVLVEEVEGDEVVAGVEGVEAPPEPPLEAPLEPEDEPDELGVLEESDLRESVR
jgi:hypothetical protein